MTHYLRDNKRNTIIETECWVKREDWKYIEVSSTVDIIQYSRFLLDNLERAGAVMAYISELDELRGWLWEVYFMNEKNDPSKIDDVNLKISQFYQKVAKELNLYYITD